MLIFHTYLLNRFCYRVLLVKMKYGYIVSNILCVCGAVLNVDSLVHRLSVYWD